MAKNPKWQVLGWSTESAGISQGTVGFKCYEKLVFSVVALRSLLAPLIDFKVFLLPW